MANTYNLTLTTPITYVSGITYAEIQNSGFVQNSDLVGSGYVRSINGLKNTPTIVGSGSVQVWVDGQTVQIGTTAGGGTPESDQYPVDARAVSGHILMGSSGRWNYGSIASPGQTVFANSGVFTSGVYVSGLPVPTQSQITTSGYVQHVDMLVSGYLKHADLLSSGYVRSVNGLANAPTVVGSGSVQVWVDGSTIQIGTTAGAGTPESDQYPVDARAVSGNIVPSTSGAYNLGSNTKFFHQIWANSGIFQSGISVSGQDILYKINGLGGPHININPGYGVEPLVLSDHTIFINVSGDTTYSSLHTSGYIRNSDFIQSGFITKAEVASSGFTTRTELINSGYVRHTDMLVSGYLRHADLLASGYVRSIKGLSNTPDIIGSGNIQVWIDGTTIQIGTTVGAGTPEPDQYPVDARAVSGHILMNSSGQWNYGSVTSPGQTIYANSGVFTSGIYVSGLPVPTQSQITTSGYVRHTDMLVSGYARLPDLLGSGFKPESQIDHGTITGLLDNDHPQYILNSAFVGSGFITKAEVASSGFATRSELVTSGYMRHTDMLVSGYLRHGDLLSSGYVRSIKGLSNTPTIIGSGSVQVWVDGATIQIGTTAGAGGGLSQQQVMAIGSLKI